MPGRLRPASPAACAPRLWPMMCTSAGEYPYSSWQNSNKHCYVCLHQRQGGLKRGWKTTFNLPAGSAAPVGFLCRFCPTQIFQISLFSCYPGLEDAVTPGSSVRSPEGLCILPDSLNACLACKDRPGRNS